MMATKESVEELNQSRNPSSLLSESSGRQPEGGGHTRAERGVRGLAADGVEARIRVQVEQLRVALLEGAREPGESRPGLAERCVEAGDLERDAITAGGVLERALSAAGVFAPQSRQPARVEGRSDALTLQGRHSESSEPGLEVLPRLDRATLLPQHVAEELVGGGVLRIEEQRAGQPRGCGIVAAGEVGEPARENLGTRALGCELGGAFGEHGGYRQPA